MIRVMHISDMLRFGGIEKVIRNFASYLNRDEYCFSACALDSDGQFGDEIRSMGLPVFIMDKRPGLDLRLLHKLYRLFRDERIDVIHTHNFAPLMYASIPARAAGVKVLVHTEHARTTFPDKKRRMVAERLVSRLVDTITAVSTQVKQDLVCYEKIQPQKVQVIWNGIELDVPSADHSSLDIRDEFHISGEAVLVGVCCRLTAQKGVSYLLKAAPIILQKHPNTIFLIVGDGVLRADLESLVEHLGIRQSVIFTGFRTDVYHILALLDIYVLPSLYEGTSLGLLEAMLAGKTVVATRVGSNADVIQDHVSGRLVDPKRPDQLADVISSLLSSPFERRRMEQLARERVQSQFSVHRMIQEYDLLYRGLIRQKTG